jgi:hypothetical protein
VFPVRYRKIYSVELIKVRTMDNVQNCDSYINIPSQRWIMSRIVIVILIYHRHKPIDSINLLDS